MRILFVKIFILVVLVVEATLISVTKLKSGNPYKDFLDLNKYAMTQDFDFELESPGGELPIDYSIHGKCGTVMITCQYICIGRSGFYCGKRYIANPPGLAYDLSGICFCGTPVPNN
jgi:hypothetical protein